MKLVEARSSYEFEYRVMALGAYKLLRLQILLSDLGFLIQRSNDVTF